MRIGNLEIPGGLLVMPAFVLVIALLLLWSWYYHSKQKSEMRTLAASRGWSFLGKDPPELRPSLEEMDADRNMKWFPDDIILVEGPPNKVYLFNYQANDYTSRSAGEFGTACFAERRDGQTGELVMIDHRSPLPLVDKLEQNLLGDMPEVGGPEFRRAFMVRSRRPDIVEATVTSGMQEVLLRQASSFKWHRVWIAGRRVLVTVTWRLKPEEWDELLGISRRLLAALP